LSKPLFTVVCTTCETGLSVRDASAIGRILACPKCGGMVQITPPEGWKPEPPPLPSEKRKGPPAPEKSVPGPPPLVHDTHAHETDPPEVEIDDSHQFDHLPDPVEELDFDETIDEAEHLASRGHRLSESERRIRRILMGAGAGIAGLILILGLVFLINPNDSDDEDPVPGSDERPPVAQALTPIEADWTLARTFLLPDSSLFLTLNTDALSLIDRPALFDSDPNAKDGRGLESVRESLKLLELPTSSIQRLEWNSPDDGDLESPLGSILVVRLKSGLEDESARIEGVGDASPQHFGSLPCRSVGAGDRRLEFALIDPETIIMGPSASLRVLADRLIEKTEAANATATVLPEEATTPTGSSFLPDEDPTSPPTATEDPSLEPLAPLPPIGPPSTPPDDAPGAFPPLAPLSPTGTFVSPDEEGAEQNPPGNSNEEPGVGLSPLSPSGTFEEPTLPSTLEAPEDEPLAPLTPIDTLDTGSDPSDISDGGPEFATDSVLPPVPTAIERLGDLIDEIDPNATFSLAVDLRNRSDIEMLFPVESILLDELALPARDLIAETDFFALTVKLPVQAPEGTLNEDRSFFPEPLSDVSEDASATSGRQFGPGEIQITILLASEPTTDGAPSLSTIEQRAQTFLDAVGTTSSSFAQIASILKQGANWDAATADAAVALLTETQRFAEDVAIERDARLVRLHLNSHSDLFAALDAASRLDLDEFAPLRDALLESFQSEQIERILGAIESYRDENENRFPQGVQGESMLPADTRLSWFVSLLPHLGFGSLTEFNSGSSWNGSTNATGTRQPLPPVRNPIIPHQTSEDGFPVTHYVGVAGLGVDAPDLPFEDARVGVFGYRRSIQMDDITDGASQTLAILPVTEDAGPWAAGGRSTIRGLTEGPYVNGPDGFSSGQSGGMVVGMADGSARFLSSQTAPEVVESMATIHGGERIDTDDFWVRPSRPLPPRVPLTDREAPDPGIDVTPNIDDPDGANTEIIPPDPPDPLDPAGGVLPSVEERPELVPLTNDELAIRLSLPIQAIDFPNTKLVDAVDAISELSGAPMSYDFDWLRRRSIRVDAQLAGQYADASLGKVLADHLLAAGLTYELRNGGIWITPPEAMQTEPRTTSYTISDLASDADELTQFATLITQMVEPQSWAAAGGTGRIAVHNGALAVDQTEAVHYEILIFCEKLRVARRLPPKSNLNPALFALSTPYERAASLRGVDVTLNFFPPGKLGRVLNTLEERTGATLVPNWESLAEVRLNYESEAAVSAAVDPLEETLDELLLPLDADYRIVNETTIEILSAQDARARHDFMFIPNAGLITPNRDIEDLRDFLRITDPEHWGDLQTHGAVVYDVPSDTLIVRQCSRAMRTFDETLLVFRQSTP
jgi:hypothetical protein